MSETSEATHQDPVWRERSNFVIGASVGNAGNTEQLVARQLARYRFEVCCIPFFTYGIALGDVVETDSEYTVARIVKRSGRRTFRVWFGDSFAPREEIAQDLANLGALLEWSSTNLLAIDAKDEATAKSITDYLRKQGGEGNIVYEEGE